MFVVLPVHVPVAEPPATRNTPHPPAPSCTMNWLVVGLARVGLIHASNVIFAVPDDGARAELYGTVGCAVSVPAKYSE